MSRSRIWLLATGVAIVAIITSIPVLTDPSGRKYGVDAVTAATKKKPKPANPPAAQPQAEPGKNFDATADLARKAIEKGDLVAAKQLVDAASRQAKAPGVDRAADLVALTKDFDDACRKLIDAANADYEAAKYPEAIKQYQKIAAMSELPIAKEAADKLKAAQSDPKVKAVADSAAAEKIYAPVAALLEAERKKAGQESAADADLVAKMTIANQASVFKNLETLQKQYPDTDTGKKAVELLAKLQTDTAMVAAVKQWQANEGARNVFQMAQTYDKAGMVNKAITAYEDVVRDYPASDYAAKAKDRLAELKKVAAK